MIIKLLVDGGDMKPGPAVAQKIGPIGVNMGKVISDVNTATSSFKGLKVPVILDVNPKDKSFTIKVSSPPVSGLLKKELGLELGSGEPHKIKVANMSIEQVISIAKMKHPNMLAKNLKAAVKSVVGTCVSLGVLVENKEAKDILMSIEQGNYDEEIESEVTETSPEKKQKLEQYFAEVKVKQDKMLKKEEEEKVAEEAAKVAAAEAPGAEKAVEGEKPAEEAEAVEGEKPAETEEKPEEGK